MAELNQTQFSADTVAKTKSPRFDTGADGGVSRHNEHNPGLLSQAYGHTDVPITEPKTTEGRDAEIGRAAARVVQSHVNPGRNSSESFAGAKNLGKTSQGYTVAQNKSGQAFASAPHMPVAGSKEHHALENDRILDSGEKFYSHDAHGTALAIAGGFNSGSPEANALARTGGHSSDIRRDYGNRLSESQIQSHNSFHQQLAAHREAHPENPGVALHNERTESIRNSVNNTSTTDLKKASGLLAVTSPQNPWEANKKDAFEIRDLESKHPAVANEIKTTEKGSAPAGGVGKTVTPNGILPAAKKVTPAERASRQDQAMSINHLPYKTIRAGMDIANGGDSEKYVSTDETHRVKIGNFKTNIENPYGGASVPGTHLNGGQFGKHEDALVNKFGETGRVNKDNRMPQKTAEGLMGQGNRNATVDFRANDIATGYATPTSLAPGLSQSKTSKTRDAAGRRYDMLNEAHGRAADYVNAHHPEHTVGSLPLNPAQIQGTTWTRDRVHQNMEQGGSGKGVKGQGEAIGAGRNAKPVGQPAAKGETEQMGSYFKARAERQELDKKK